MNGRLDSVDRLREDGGRSEINCPEIHRHSGRFSANWGFICVWLSG